MDKGETGRNLSIIFETILNTILSFVFNYKKWQRGGKKPKILNEYENKLLDYLEAT